MSLCPHGSCRAARPGLTVCNRLERQADILVGTPIRKGISGGQKRRLGVASQLITSPALLFMDEPTSGLDSVASFEVLKYIRKIARRYGLIVIVSIHQPSSTTFQLFDKLLLLSRGKTCYFGDRVDLAPYFAGISHPIPHYVNPAEAVLEFVNDDFASLDEASTKRLQDIFEAWETKQQAEKEANAGTLLTAPDDDTPHRFQSHSQRPNVLVLSTVLLHRNFIKSYRDILLFGVRAAMYIGLAIMSGTVWLRLGYVQTSIQPFINSLFFGGAFMSFMAVAGVPSTIEDLSVLKKDRANGLYGPLPFLIANFLISMPYLFSITLVYSIITYFLTNFRPSGSGFFYYVMWLFFDLLAAESLVVLVTSLIPVFVIALAIVAFANGSVFG